MFKQLLEHFIMLTICILILLVTYNFGRMNPRSPVVPQCEEILTYHHATQEI